jgi:hypothetical protein
MACGVKKIAVPSAPVSGEYLSLTSQRRSPSNALSMSNVWLYLGQSSNPFEQRGRLKPFFSLLSDGGWQCLKPLCTVSLSGLPAIPALRTRAATLMRQRSCSELAEGHEQVAPESWVWLQGQTEALPIYVCRGYSSTSFAGEHRIDLEAPRFHIGWKRSLGPTAIIQA